MIDDTLDVPDEVIDRDVGDPQVEPAIFGQGLGVFALVVLLTDREPAVERHHSRLAAVRRERGHDARVESAAEIGADRHVGPQVDADRILHPRLQLLLEIG